MRNDDYIDVDAQYFSDIDNYNRITPEEEVELSKAVMSGDIKARNKLIEANLSLVTHYASRYADTPGVDLLDLIQEGNIGLILAAENFDYRKGTRFSTYATYKILAAIKRYIQDNKRSVRLPVNKSEDLYRLKQAEEQFEKKNGSIGTDAEIAKIIGMSESAVSNLRIIRQPIESLDAPVSTHDDGDEVLLIDTLAAKDDLVASQMPKALAKIMRKYLSETELTVLKNSSCCDAGLTAKEQADAVATTYGNICAIKNRALRKLRHPEILEEIRGIL